MKVNGIIAEYNPFHNGHKFHIETSKAATGADYTVVVMSGNYVQRGAPALIDKYARTEMALNGGADLVLELPSLYACASAEYFATGGVALLDKLGVVDNLCFGSECGDVELLEEIAVILTNESPEYIATLKRFLRQGFSYPNARNWALVQHYPYLNEHQSVLNSPNNILGIEYCKSLRVRNSSTAPFTVKRAGGNYNSGEITDELCSALAIRLALFEGHTIDEIRPHLPGTGADVLDKAIREGAILRRNDFSSILYYKLISEKERGYDSYLDISKELSERILNNLNGFRSFESFCDLLKTKEITYSRISRCLLHILLNITKEDMEFGKSLDYVPYARILGFRKDSGALLTAVKEHSSIPMISKLADASKILDEDAYRFLQKELYRNKIYQGVAGIKCERAPENEFTTPIVIV